MQERAGPVGTKLTQRCSVSVLTAQKETPPRLAPGTASNRLEKLTAFKRKPTPAKRAAQAMVNAMDNWNVARWSWLRAITTDADLTPMSRLLASALVTQFSHHETAHCAPGYDRLAAALGITRDAVRKVVRALVASGWLVRSAGRGEGHRSAFTFVMKAGHASNVVSIAPKQPAVSAQSQAAEGGQINPYSTHKKGDRTAQEGGQNSTPPCTPYKEYPNSIQRARATKPRTERPMVPIERGSSHESQWNDWLRSKRLPTLVEMNPRYGDGWAVPLRLPPHPDDPMENRIAEKWVSGIASSFEARAHA